MSVAAIICWTLGPHMKCQIVLRLGSVGKKQTKNKWQFFNMNDLQRNSFTVTRKRQAHEATQFVAQMTQDVQLHLCDSLYLHINISKLCGALAHSFTANTSASPITLQTPRTAQHFISPVSSLNPPVGTDSRFLLCSKFVTVTWCPLGVLSFKLYACRWAMASHLCMTKNTFGLLNYNLASNWEIYYQLQGSLYAYVAGELNFYFKHAP